MPSNPFLDRLCVVLVSARNPLNIGAAARAMTNFGFSRLRVVKPYDVAFRNAKSGVRASGVLRQAEEFPTVADAVSDCALVLGTTAAQGRQLEHRLRTVQQASALIRRRMSSGRIALLFGSEKRGLSNEDFSHCDWLIRIPTGAKQPSMNLGQAVAVCLYEISRGKSMPLRKERQSAPDAANLERLVGLLHESLLVSEYAREGSGKEIVRRLVRRLELPSADAHLLQGMLRQMLWKMRHRG